MLTGESENTCVVEVARKQLLCVPDRIRVSRRFRRTINGSIPPSYVVDLLALPATGRRIVDANRFGGLAAAQDEYARDASHDAYGANGPDTVGTHTFLAIAASC